MAWIELKLNILNEAVDWVNTLLADVNYPVTVHLAPYVPFELGQSDVSESDAEPAIDSGHIQSDTELSWAHTMRLHLPYDSYASTRVAEITTLLSPLQRTGLTTALQTTVVENLPPTQAMVNAHRIGERFVVLAPGTSHTQHQNDLILELEPSFAFGSGFHPATHLSLQLLERYVGPEMHTLDLGSGSGILSVAMAKMGAQVLALDNDPVAVQATQDAVCRNGVEQQVIVQQGSLGQGSDLGHWMGGKTIDAIPSLQPIAEFDLIAANILARIHITLAPDFHRALRRTNSQNGILITAGFTTDYVNEVNNALSEVGFVAIDRIQREEWVALAHRLT